MSELFTKFSFIQLSWWQRQGLPTSLNESQYDVWSSRISAIVLIYSKHADCVLRLLNLTDLLSCCGRSLRSESFNHSSLRLQLQQYLKFLGA